jgi:hypothetical protein
MTLENTAAPEGAATEPFTTSAAAALLDRDDENTSPNPTTPEATTQETSPAEPEEASGEEASPPDEGESNADPETYVHGNAKTRLRDGREVTVAELKRLAGEAEEFRRRSAEFDAQSRDLQTKQAQLAQQSPFFDQTLKHAIGVLQANIPPEPAPALREQDPIEYFLQKDRRDAKLVELNRLQQAQQANDRKVQAEQAQAQKERLELNQKRLYEMMPELREPAKREQWWGKVSKMGTSLGFTSAEMNRIDDPRVMVMADKAAKWDELQANKPKAVAKAANATPVQPPGRRTSPAETQGKAIEGLIQRAKSSGGKMDDIAAIIAARNL